MAHAGAVARRDILTLTLVLGYHKAVELVSRRLLVGPKPRSVVLLIAGALLVMSSLAHACRSWPPLRAALVQAQVDAGSLRAVAVAWFFSSAAILTFAAIVIATAWAIWRGRATSPLPVLLVAAAYLLFGIATLFYEGQSRHFLFFVVLAGLMAAGAYVPRQGFSNEQRGK